MSEYTHTEDADKVSPPDDGSIVGNRLRTTLDGGYWLLLDYLTWMAEEEARGALAHGLNVQGLGSATDKVSQFTGRLCDPKVAKEVDRTKAAVRLAIKRSKLDATEKDKLLALLSDWKVYKPGDVLSRLVALNTDGDGDFTVPENYGGVCGMSYGLHERELDCIVSYGDALKLDGNYTLRAHACMEKVRTKVVYDDYGRKSQRAVHKWVMSRKVVHMVNGTEVEGWVGLPYGNQRKMTQREVVERLLDSVLHVVVTDSGEDEGKPEEGIASGTIMFAGFRLELGGVNTPWQNAHASYIRWHDSCRFLAQRDAQLPLPGSHEANNVLFERAIETAQRRAAQAREERLAAVVRRNMYEAGLAA